MKVWQTLRDWTLVLAMVAGVAGYYIYVNIPFLGGTHAFAAQAVAITQPALIFAMLFLTFCKVDLRRMRLCRWHAWLLLIQGGAFAAGALAVTLVESQSARVVIEGAMLCMICPTATAAAVVTRKLGGDINSITAYTILVNLLATVLIPVLTPFFEPGHGMSSVAAMLLILSKVFPLLLLPLALAVLAKRFTPGVVRAAARYPDLSFYLWAVALALAIAVTVRSIVHSHVALSTQGALVAVSLAACALQFWAGWKIGARYGDKTTAGQALGQKNTVLAIWIGYTFFTPVTSIVGGFYSIWHNVVNTYQLARHKSANH